ncbi:MAG: hypothetical protein ACRD8Z_26955 [Nitrososphaeraceae archaeon]
MRMRKENGFEIRRFAEKNEITVQTNIVKSSMPPEGSITRYAQEHEVDVIVVGIEDLVGLQNNFLVVLH